MRFIRFLLLAALLALFGCGKSPKVDKLDANAVVLAFGDSLTYGTGAATSDSYPAVLEKRIGRKVVNAGVPGETSGEGLARLPGVIDEVQPRILILCHGGNDFLRKMDDAGAAENVRAMIRLAREKGIGVVLLATPKPGIPPAVPSFYREISADLKIPFDEGTIKGVLLDSRLKSDFVHPNAQGYAKIADAVQELLRKAGAI
jgi:lysophospholipase L1-like esterase